MKIDTSERRLPRTHQSEKEEAEEEECTPAEAGALKRRRKGGWKE